MQITLVQPRLGSPGVKGSMEPLAMGMLARFTPPGVSLRFIDESVEEIPDRLSTDLVAMSVTTLTARRAYDLAAGFRARGIAVVMGGVHPTLLPDEALQHADAIVQGIGEAVWPTLLADLAGRKLQRTYLGSSEGSMAGLTPDRSIFSGKRYGPLVPVQFGRGCPFSCDFCAVHVFHGNRITHRPVAEVLEEIACLGRRRILFFVDDNLHAYGQASAELLHGMARLRVRWIGQASVNAARDPETVKLLAASGCVALLIGFESLEEESLHQMHKGVNIRSDYLRAVELLQKHGIMVGGSFLFGYRSDSARSVRKALQFAERMNFVHAYFNPLVPMPGTAIYQRLLAEDRFTDPRWWLSEDFRYGQIPFAPQGATAAELEQACISARRKFDTLRSIALRGIRSRANWYPLRNLILFWLANLVYRAEYRRKYARPIFTRHGS